MPPPAVPSPQTPLFTLPMAPLPPQYPEGGSITCTEPQPQVYLLTFVSPPDNRLTTPFCDAMLQALDIIEFSYPVGVVVTTSGIPKFYSNGLDLNHAVATEGYWGGKLYRLWKRFLTYPMPTVALLNGHAFAGGLMLGFHHDYRVFNPSRGFLCVNELEFGAPLKEPMSAIFRCKTSSPQTYRSLVLEAKRFGGPQALEAGLVDALGGLEEALNLVKERRLTEKGKTGVYGSLKAEMYRECVGYLEGFEKGEERAQGIAKEVIERSEAGKMTVKEWMAKRTKL